jgi:crossover junction endodeoxyribonuclease RusA
VIRLTLPFPPSLNTMFPSGKNGRRFLSQKGKDFAIAVKAKVWADRTNLQYSKPTLPPRLGLRLMLCPPDKRTRDLDNHIKAVADSLTKAGVWADDEQIDKLVVERGPIVKGGKCSVFVWDLYAEIMP